MFLLLSLPFWAVGIGLIVAICFSLAGQFLLQIDSDKIEQILDLFGFQVKWPRPSNTQDIDKLEFVDTHWTRGKNGRRLKVPARLFIGAGQRRYRVGAFLPLQKRELLWVGQELSNWLGIPLNERKKADTVKTSN